MQLLLWIIHVGAAIAIVTLVLLQHGKGADVGAAFGSGSAGGVFGSAGSANFLSRSTAMLAVVFFLTSMSLSYFSTRPADTEGVMRGFQPPADSLPAQVPGPAPAPTPPATPAPAAPAESGKAGQIPN
jgi:preprotein translocase subunit SecG